LHLDTWKVVRLTVSKFKFLQFLRMASRSVARSFGFRWFWVAPSYFLLDLVMNS
jgi:hypothetical protein